MRIIGGSARGRKLEPPPDRSTRPALDRLRESIFQIVGEEVVGCRVLDLFAGVGAFGLEAISRGARHATFVDRSVRVLSVLERNIDALGFRGQTSVLCGDALAVPDIRGADAAFGLVFMDPPFPLFWEAESAEAVFARVADLLRSPATGDDGLIVLRLPEAYREPLPFPKSDVRDYGRSRIALLRPSDLVLDLPED